MKRSPRLGLVCVTLSNECRYRTITRTQYLSLGKPKRRAALRELYWANLWRLNRTLSFCDRHDIRLYRVTSTLFPMSDDALGESVLRELSANLSSIGRRASRLGIRIVMHPDQFVVLNSEAETVVATSKLILQKQALWFDMMGLPESPWSAMIIHGGKSGRANELVESIGSLPPNVRNRLCLENDEYCYSAAEILKICKRASVPMIFDNLHHVIREKLTSYDDASIAKFVKLAQRTWPDANWQMVHLSNGHSSFLDRNHSEMIVDMPKAYARVPWIEVEARGKECAIRNLRESGA
jgi:UV DNA damage endonuclease